MDLQSIVRWLLPRSDHFFDLLESQAVVAHESAQALARFLDPEVTAEMVCAAVQALEHRGDEIVHQVEEALAKTFVTPIDREDIQRLSVNLDDVIDFTNFAARACLLLGVTQPTAPMRAMIEVLAQATGVVAEAVPQLRRHRYPELIAANRRLRQFEKDGDKIFRDAVSQLFHSPEIDAKVLLREREVLDDLESALDRCEMVGGTLAMLAVKHG